MDVSGAIFSLWMVLSAGHTTPLESAGLLCLWRQWTASLHIYCTSWLSCFHPLLLENFQGGSVFTSARLIQNTTSGVLNRLWNTFLHSAQLGSVGGLPVNLLLSFVILLVAEGLWFPYRSSNNLFRYFFLKFLPEPWLIEPCIIMTVVFRIPYL